ncbi:MAG TPA: L,D-transpeptidase family protein [Rhizomicrobium sp.]|nr:L,D-transpeptidase family protein [Rhizomicrobium sp.]
MLSVMFWRLIIVAALLLVCGSAAAQPSGFGPAMETALSSTDDGGLTRRFYQQRNGALAWGGSATADAKLAIAMLSNAASEGLDPGRYRIFANSGNAVADDVAISAAMLAYMRDLAIGRPDLRALDTDVSLPLRFLDTRSLLNDALRQGRLAATLGSLAPQYPDYATLKSALARHLAPTEVIAANMERWRWLPAAWEPDRIVVNAADAQLQLWLGGKMVLTSRVVVGRPQSRTPILRAEGAGITINPPWTVPRSIAAKEILPKLKANRAYLAEHDMILLDGPAGDPHGLHINWRAVRAGTFPYRIRQYPGPRNPLGRVKIELPNRFDVYLHDTPGKAAFAKPNRALSHGCVRVEQILPLASYALSGDLETVEKITQAIGAGETQYLPLSRRLPVYFLYWTAFAGPDGAMQVRPDIYGRDQRLIAAMRTRPMQIAANFAACAKG